MLSQKKSETCSPLQRNSAGDKRASRRIPVHMQVHFFYDDIMYAGYITSISKTGMYIRTDTPLYYYKVNFSVIIPLLNGMMEVPVKIARLSQTCGYYQGMGVEITGAPRQYAPFIDRLRSSLWTAQEEQGRENQL